MQQIGHLPEIVVLLAAAVCIVALFKSLRLSPVLGYLAAGAAIGPYGAGIISDIESTAAIAEFGVILLLFLIGLELSFERLLGMRKHVFGFGTAQMVLTSLAIGFVTYLLGEDVEVAIIVGGGLAMSSTAVVLQVLADTGEKASQVGRLSLATLILQDLAVIPLLVMVPKLAGSADALAPALAGAVGKAVAGLAVVFILGRIFLKPLYRFIGSLGSNELFTATTLLVVLGLAMSSHMIGLSAALGAFVAGLLVAGTEFKHQIEADILPFKGVLLGLFFMTVGMSLDLKLVVDQFGVILALAVALMFGKAALIYVLSRMFGFSKGAAIHAGLVLSQAGEFAFVLFSLAATMGVLPHSSSPLLLVVITMSMALTPLMAALGKRLADLSESKQAYTQAQFNAETLDLKDHIVIAGYGRVGHTVARLLENEEYRYIALDMHADAVASEHKRGIPVYYGDAARPHVLKAVGIARARAAVITHSDVRTSTLTIHAIRTLNPDIPIIARARNIEQVQMLEKAGANLAIAEMFETSLQLGGALLREVGTGEQEVTRILDLFRDEDYALTRAAES